MGFIISKKKSLIWFRDYTNIEICLVKSLKSLNIKTQFKI